MSSTQVKRYESRAHVAIEKCPLIWPGLLQDGNTVMNGIWNCVSARILFYRLVFSTGTILPCRGHLAMLGDHFVRHNGNGRDATEK